MSDRGVKWLLAVVTLVLVLALCGVGMLLRLLIAGVPAAPTQPQASDPAPTTAATEPEPTVPETQWVPTSIYGPAPEGYFEDALFIGDSRTVGIAEYGDIPGATFFAISGGGLYSVPHQSLSVPDYGYVTLDELLENNTFGKIYLMLGVNDLWQDRDTNVQTYQALLEHICQLQPDAIVYVQANLQVSEAFTAGNDYVTRANINWFNQQIRLMADNERIFYLDVNLVFVDPNGFLNPLFTGDGLHLYEKYYAHWAQWIMDHAVTQE